MDMSPADMREHELEWRRRERRQSMRIARLTALLANIHRKKGASAMSADDFCEFQSEDEE